MKTSFQAIFICGVLAGIHFAKADDTRLVQTSGYGVDGLVLWLAADSGITRDANNRVTSLVDKTGNFTLTASSSGRMPIFVPNGLNGKPVLRFDGAECLSSSENFGTALNRDMTIIVVAMTTASSDCLESPLFLGKGDVPATSRAFFYYRGQEFLDGHYAGFFGEPMVSNAFLMSAGTINPALTQATFYRNGARTIVSGPAGETNNRRLENLSAGVTMGASPVADAGWQWDDAPVQGKLSRYPGIAGASAGWQGDIAEELVYDRQLTDAEVQSIWQRLSDKYDLPQAVAPQAPPPAPPDDLGRPLVIKEPCGLGNPLPLIIGIGVGITIAALICFSLVLIRLDSILTLLANTSSKSSAHRGDEKTQSPPKP